MIKRQIFYVGVTADERFILYPYGFTNYGDCYVEAETAKEAGQTAKNHFESKYKVRVSRTRPMIANPKFHNPVEIIKQVQKPVQLTIFDINTDYKKAAIIKNTQRRNKQKSTLTSLCERSIVYINRIFGKLKSFDRA